MSKPSRLAGEAKPAKALGAVGRSPRLSSDASKRARTRARLTEAALRLMSERGINATSVSEIAAAAELANGTFSL